MAVWDDMNNLEPIRYYDKGVEANHYTSFGEFHMILRDGTITIPKLKLFEPLLRQDQEFVKCVRDRSQPTANGEFGLGVVRVLAAARESLAQRGQMVPVSAR
jgi:predicted dehydrogenase